MPEGDSVYLNARTLETALRGQVLTRGELHVPAHATADLAGRTVTAVETHGKHLLTHLSGTTPDGTDDLVLHTHQRMDGSWTVTRPGRRLPRHLDPDVRVLLQAGDGRTAYGLRMPVVELLRTADLPSVVGHLGPDPLRPDWDPVEAVRRLTADPARPVAAALLDQQLVAGFGNLWVNELCFLRGHSPWTPIGDVDVPALVRLGARALRVSATSPGAYQITTGNTRRGEQHWVAGRAGRPCLRCGTPVRVAKETADERRTWWCPHCQPGPLRRSARSAGPSERRG